MNQATVAGEVKLSGVGLHTGVEVNMTIRPAGVDTGISFVRTDLAESPNIPVNLDNLIGTERETTLGRGEVAVHTVEHLLSACSGLGIDNLIVEIDGPEVPVVDGSARPFFEAIKSVGLKRLTEPRRFFRVREPIWMEDGEKQIVVLPSTEFRVSYTLHYPDSSIGSQFFSLTVDPESYERELVDARTFCTFEEVEMLRNAGLIKGGSLNNAIVFDKDGLIDQCEARYPDEPVRHKILDLIGDLMFLGCPLKGHVIVVRGGHSLNVRMTRKLSDLRRKTAAYYHQSIAVANEQLDIEAIKQVLPHRYPFLLVDRILSIEPMKKVVGLKNVTGNEPFFQGHFPRYPIMPGVLIMEAMAQVGGVILLSGSNTPGRLVFFMGMDNVKFRKPVVPGDQIIFEVEATKIRSRIGHLRGQAYVEGSLVAEGDLKFSIPPEES